jgi:hypothetical protein
MHKVFLYLFAIFVLAIAVPAQAMTCGEFNGLGPAAKNLQTLIAQPASHAQVEVYRKMIADHAASIAFLTITPRARGLKKLSDSKEGLVPLVRESLALTRAACFGSPNLNFEDTGKGEFNYLLDAWGK